MALNPVISTLGRRLRLAMIGGGPGSFIGAMHRQAARLDDRYEIVTGILTSDPERSKQAASELGFAQDRLYSNVTEMLDAEVSRKDGIDAVAIMTPNDTHCEYSLAALERGIDVICDKPMTNTLEEAESLHKKVQETGLVFCLTHNYTGYPMVRQAKAMVQDGQLGTIRLIQVEYVQGGKADEEKPMPEVMTWKYDPVRGGPSRVMGDIGTHAHNLTRFITGLEVDEVSAEVGTIVPNRLIHDFAGALLHFDNGARGGFWVTQAAAGVENCLRIRVSGSQGSLEWMQEFPQALTFKPLQGPSQNRTPNGPGTLPLSARSTRLVAGHPEGFPDGFANIYSDAAEAISARRAGKEANPLALYFPNSWDGLLGVRFVNSVIESSSANGKWIKC
jgi:Predicted dehydrogenases and related proteins